MDTLYLALNIVGGISVIIGMFILLRGYWKSKTSDKLDFRAYIVGMFFVLVFVGLMMLKEWLRGY